MTLSTLVLVAILSTGQVPNPELVEPVRKIWDQAPHNAFTDLIRFQDRWWCVFREGDDHAKGAGKIRLLISTDGVEWESVALFSQAGVDLRDPHISRTPKGELMLICGAAEPPTRDPVKDHYGFISFSKDGLEWTTMSRVGPSWHWLWRVSWDERDAYTVAYHWQPDGKRQYRAKLMRDQGLHMREAGRRGVNFEAVTEFDVPQATEATLVFDGPKLLCLQRRDGSPNSALLGTSQPPYTKWTWKDLGLYYGGPNFLKAPDGHWWATGRIIDNKKAQTVLCHLDVVAGKLTPVLTLPSGGDTSYPGMVWHDGQLWISYYSSHEGKSNIYLARVRFTK
jgi:hypothetical protein